MIKVYQQRPVFENHQLFAYQMNGLVTYFCLVFNFLYMIIHHDNVRTKERTVSNVKEIHRLTHNILLE